MLKAKRQGLPGERVHCLSRRIEENLSRLEDFRKASVIMAYVAVRGEVETAGVIEGCFKGGKTVLVPWCDPESSGIHAAALGAGIGNLVPARYGIPAPPVNRLELFPSATIEIVLVPGIGFDPRGVRLGWGKGYYDAFLSGLSPEAKKIALAYEFQVVRHIAERGGDVLMDRIITEERIIDCGTIREKCCKL